MKKMMQSFRKIFDKCLLSLLGVLGFSCTTILACHSNKQKIVSEEKVEESSHSVAVCMYGVPPSVYERMDTTIIDEKKPREDISSEEKENEMKDSNETSSKE